MWHNIRDHAVSFVGLSVYRSSGMGSVQVRNKMPRREIKLLLLPALSCCRSLVALPVLSAVDYPIYQRDRRSMKLKRRVIQAEIADETGQWQRFLNRAPAEIDFRATGRQTMEWNIFNRPTDSIVPFCLSFSSSFLTIRITDNLNLFDQLQSFTTKIHVYTMQLPFIILYEYFL